MLASRLLPCAGVLALALLCLADVGGQTTQKPAADVTVTGKEAGVVSIDIDGKKERFIFIDLDGRTTLKVRSNQDVSKFNEKLLADHKKLTDAFGEDSKKLIANNDFQPETEFFAAKRITLQFSRSRQPPRRAIPARLRQLELRRIATTNQPSFHRPTTFPALNLLDRTPTKAPTVPSNTLTVNVDPGPLNFPS